MSQAIPNSVSVVTALPEAQDAAVQRNAIGRTLRQLRKEHDLTQEKLAERVGFTPEYLSMVERGRRRGSLKLVRAIGEAFGFNFEELLHSVTERKPPPALAQFLRSQDDDVTDEEIRLLEGLSLPGRVFTVQAYALALAMIRSTKPEQ